MEVELNLGKGPRWPLVALVGVLVLVGVGALGATYTVEDDGRPLLLTWSRYELYRYQNGVESWCQGLATAEALAEEVFGRDDPDPLVYSPALRRAWAALDDLERAARDAPPDAAVLRDEVLAASAQVRQALTAAGVYVHQPTGETRLGLSQALAAAQKATEALCPNR